MHNFLIVHLKWFELSKSSKNKLIKFFIDDHVRLLDSFSSEDQRTWTISFLAEKSILLDKLIQFNLQNFNITKSHLYSVVFNPLHLKDLKQMSLFLMENLKRFQNSLQRSLILSGYIPDPANPVYFQWESPDKVFGDSSINNIPQKSLIKGDFEKSRPIFTSLCPYPIIIYIKVAVESAESLNILKDRIDKFLQKRTPEQVKIPLIQYSYSTNEAMTIGKIALKIIDYKLLPVHNAMIFLYDTFEKINIVPVEAEFGQPVPMDIIQTAIDDLFSNLEAGITPSTEMIKTLNLFRFNIEEIFEYPSYIIEKRFGLI